MSAQAFFENMENQILEDVTLSRKSEKAKRMKDQEEKDRKQKLLNMLIELVSKIKIRVPNVSKSDLSIDQDNLAIDMEETMILHSNVINDLQELRNAKEEMKIILNGIVQELHHKFRFKNSYTLKSGKEVEIYIAGDPVYNQVNVQIKKVEAQIEKSQEFSSLLKSKIGFIRDLTKLQTQKLFGESRG